VDNATVLRAQTKKNSSRWNNASPSRSGSNRPLSSLRRIEFSEPLTARQIPVIATEWLERAAGLSGRYLDFGRLPEASPNSLRQFHRMISRSELDEIFLGSESAPAVPASTVTAMTHPALKVPHKTATQIRVTKRPSILPPSRPGARATLRIIARDKGCGKFRPNVDDP
jgi:hypothetical protein